MNDPTALIDTNESAISVAPRQLRRPAVSKIVFRPCSSTPIVARLLPRNGKMQWLMQ